MQCLKCGQELKTEQVFCDDCLKEMEKYPVSPNAAVHLPLRKESAPRKPQSRRRSITPEEQIKLLKKRLWFLTGVLVVTLALMAAMVKPTAEYFIRRYNLRPGQNYSTITPKSTTEPTEESTEVPTTVDPFEGMAE